MSVRGEQEENGGGGVAASDGGEFEPYALAGYFDRWNNYIPGYYDESGTYRLGYGYWDDDGAWRVAYGYYRPDGTWVATEAPVEQGPRPDGGAPDEQPSEISGDLLRQAARSDDVDGGDTLEIAHFWGDQVLDVQTYPTPRDVSVGGERSDDFTVEDGAVTGDSQPIIRWEGGAYYLVLSQGMSGRVADGRREWTVEEAIEQGIARPLAGDGTYQLRIGAKTTARLRVGTNTFVVRFVHMPANVGAGAAHVDTQPIPYYTLSAVAHAAFLLLALTLPGRAGALEMDRHAALDRFVDVQVQPEQKEEEESLEIGGGEDGGEPAEKHEGEEGEAGKPSAEATDKRMAVEGPPDTEDVEISPARDEQVAMGAGAMQVFQENGMAGDFQDDTTVGRDAMSALGNLDGSEPGESGGLGALGMTGPGSGGGGDDESQGIGDIMGDGGPGRPGHPCEPYPECAKADIGSKRQATVTTPKLDHDLDVTSGLTRDMIRRVVRQHRRELKYCYEQQLQSNPGLAGRLKVDFTIAPSGDVIAALIAESTLGNAAVESCVSRKIRHWTFPATTNGNVVKVTYPFNFSSGS